MCYLVNKVADCFNNIVFIFVAKISSKKVCEKWKDNSTLEKVLLARRSNRNAELLRLIEATFVSQVASFKSTRKKNLIILKRLRKKSSPFFVYLFVIVVIRVSNINWHFSESCNMLTERSYDSAVFKIFLNIITVYLLLRNN